MLLGLEPGYRGRDERLDRRVLAAVLAMLGGGIAFLLAVVFVAFPEWIDPQAFATHLLSSFRVEAPAASFGAAPLPVVPAATSPTPYSRTGPVRGERAEGIVEDRSALAEENTDAAGSAETALEPGAPLEPTRGMITSWTAPEGTEVACPPQSIECTSSADTPARVDRLERTVEPSPIIVPPTEGDATPVEPIAGTEPLPPDGAAPCDGAVPDGCALPPAPPVGTPPGQPSPPGPPGGKPGDPPGRPPVTPPAEPPGPPSPPRTPPVSPPSHPPHP